jgi:hypothetical protein
MTNARVVGLLEHHEGQQDEGRHLGVLVPGAPVPVGHQVPRHVAAVERRDGQDVEERQAGVDEHEPHQQRVGRGAVVHRLGREADHQPEGHRAEQAERQVGERPGHADDDVPRAHGDAAPEAGRVDGHRLRPPDGRPEERQEQRPDGIDVGDGVERQPSHAGGRVVAELPGREGVEELVDGEGQDQHDEVHHRAGQIERERQRKSSIGKAVL